MKSTNNRQLRPNEAQKKTHNGPKAQTHKQKTPTERRTKNLIMIDMQHNFSQALYIINDY